MLKRIDPASALRIQPQDTKRMIRAIEVYRLTGTALTDHFANTVSPLQGDDVFAIALRLPAAMTAERVARRVDEQFERGLLREVRQLLDRGVPESAPPFGGLVYRQVIEHMHGLRDEPGTRRLIVQENRRYARRQLIWFRKEPNLRWLDSAGERPETIDEVSNALASRAW
jgi:tRNA dimethylallyltransferase